mgnify:CR=1 FL=1
MNIDELLKKEAFLSSSNLLRVVVSKKLENIKAITFIQPKIGKKHDFGHFKVIYKDPYHSVRKKFDLHTK